MTVKMKMKMKSKKTRIQVTRFKVAIKTINRERDQDPLLFKEKKVKNRTSSIKKRNVIDLDQISHSKDFRMWNFRSHSLFLSSFHPAFSINTKHPFIPS